jgi:hypothetical protein
MIIAIIPVRNGAWILRQNLISLSTFCDKIIVGLDSCTDETEFICNDFKKVVTVVVDIKEIYLRQKEPNRRQLLLEHARKLDDSAIIVAVDADEIFSSKIITNDIRNDILKLKSGQGYEVRFRELWFTPHLFRNEDKSSWSGRLMPCMWRDDGTNYQIGDWHEGRVPRDIKLIRLNLDLLHFARVVPVIYWARMRYYIGRDVFLYKKNPLKVNYMYAATKNEVGMRLSPVPHDWYNEWEKLCANFFEFDDNVRNWFNDKLLEIILSENKKNLNKCDIWDFDWVEYFKDVHDREPNAAEAMKLKDTRKKYEKFLCNYIREKRSYPFWEVEFWSHLVVLLLNRLGLYHYLYALIKK